MRTTVTLDADVEQLVRERMGRLGISFKQALNDAIREGAPGRAHRAFATRTARMGAPAQSLDHALALAAALEDVEIVAKMERGA